VISSSDAPSQVLQRVDRGEHFLTVAARLDVGSDLLERRAVARATGRVQREIADAHRRALGVDDRYRCLAVERLGRDLRRLHGGRHARRQVDAHDAVGTVVGEAAERLLERAHGRGGGFGEYGRRLELTPERLDAQFLPVDVLTLTEADRQGHHFDAELLTGGRGEITGAIGDDAYGHASSRGAGEVRAFDSRACLMVTRLRKKRAACGPVK
jgi:hypothetical protein